MLVGRDREPELLIVLGGTHARTVLAGAEGGLEGYWPQVWAARGLLHVWDARATAAIVVATTSDAW
jgi:hypothetical protein